MMDGEYWAWYDLAYELKLPIQVCRELHTTADFNDWLVYLEKRRECDLLRVTPEHHYLAQIAAEIVRSNISDLATVRKSSSEDFLLKFVPAANSVPEQPQELTEEQRQARINQSKWAWMALFGGARSKQK